MTLSIRNILMVATVFATLFLISGVAAGQNSAVSLPTVPELRKQVLTVKSRLATDRKISASDREKISGAVNRIEMNLGDTQLYSSLSAEVQVEIINDVSLIEGIATDRGDDRLVCKRGKTVGSNRISSVCHTAAHWAELRASSEEAVRREDNRACTTVGCT